MISIWEKETFFTPQDVIIVGSGFVGLWCALHLKKKNKKIKITIVDRGVIPAGASTRNAGFACFGSLTELIADGKKMGVEKMLKLVEMRFRGLEKIQKTFRDKEIDFDMCGGYEVFTEEYHVDELETHIEYLNRLLKKIVKTKKLYKLADKKIEDFGFHQVKHMVRNQLEGYLHSGKLLKALLHQVQSMGVQVLNAVEIEKFEMINKKILVKTNQLFNLTTEKLLICTNAFARQLLPALDVEPARGQVFVTSEIEDLSWKGTFHFDEGFYYFRNLGKKILLGGARNKAFEEEKTASLETTSFIQDELERFLREVIIPGKKYTIDHRWSGIMGLGSEKMPIVKEVSPNVFCAVRMSGMGVALAPVVAEQVADMMLGE
jgi:glycine/D-amino acid oxidase-like deaminating enzyme